MPTISTRRGFVTICSALAATGSVPWVRAATKPDRLRLGFVGVGGRGGANRGGCANEIVGSICDVHPRHLATVAKQHPDAKRLTDWREMVTDDSLDGMVISTADHHHAPAAVAAMRAGKHVYVEKPLGHTVWEARLMQDEYKARRGTIATQMGTQIHAGHTYRRVVELVRAGAVGTVREVHVWCSRGIRAVSEAVLPETPVPEGFDWDVWLGPAAARPHNEGYWKGGNLNWNRRWEFGNGVLGDMGSHLIDLAYWALDLQWPETVRSEGPPPDPVAAPPWQVVEWTHAARDAGKPEGAAVKVVWYHGNEGMARRSAYLQPKLGATTDLGKWGIGVAFVGDDGILVSDYGKTVSTNPRLVKQPPLTIKPIANSLGHHAEWLHAAKTGGESLCNFDYSGRLIEHNLLGVVAHRAGKKLTWDAAAFKFPGAPEADAFLSKDYRSGWELKRA